MKSRSQRLFSAKGLHFHSLKLQRGKTMSSVNKTLQIFFICKHLRWIIYIYAAIWFAECAMNLHLVRQIRFQPPLKFNSQNLTFNPSLYLKALTLRESNPEHLPHKNYHLRERLLRKKDYRLLWQTFIKTSHRLIQLRKMRIFGLVSDPLVTFRVAQRTAFPR